MFEKFLTSVLCFTAISTLGLSEENLQSMRASLRHIEKGGVGYQNGYSTLELFLAPSSESLSITPFVDLRGHVFNDGHLASNTGLGFRTLAGCRVYGINAYYDYRNTSHQHYNQVSLGLETLGISWDFRVNGYLPIGKKKSSHYHNKTTVTSTVFNTFLENYALITQTKKASSKVEYAMKGLDSEAAFHFLKKKNIDLYAAAGPYYYNYDNKQAIGGKVRLGTQIYEYLSLELINSYDNRFYNNFQGQVGIHIPFGPKEKPTRNKKLTECSTPSLLAQRLIQDVQKQEIIVVDRYHTSNTFQEISMAINPQTGMPYSFFFVDNTSHSNGTYESPFNTLIDAQNASSPHDIIYVFPGNNTSTNMDTGITLQDWQMLLGASTTHLLTTTLGTISIPSMASTLPILTNTNTTPVVTLNNNNIVSGFYIENVSGVGLYGNAITNFTFTENTIIGGSSESLEGILLENPFGELTIVNNVFSESNQLAATNYAVHLQSSSGQSTATFTNNTFNCYSNTFSTTAIFADLSGTASINTLNVENSLFNNNGNLGSGIQISLQDESFLTNLSLSDSSICGFTYGVKANLQGSGSLTNLTISNSTLGNSVYSYGLSVTLTGTGSITNLTTLNTNFSSNLLGGGILANLQNSGSIQNLIVSNSILNNTANAISLNLSSSGFISNLELSNNLLNGNSITGLNLLLSSSGDILDIAVSNCTFNSTASGVNILLQGPGSIENFNLSDSTFYGNNYGVTTTLGDSTGSITNFTINDSSFTSIATAVNTTLQNGTGSITNLSILDNIFNINSYTITSLIQSAGSITNFTVSNNTLNSNSYGFSTQLESTGSIINLDISDNAFNYNQNYGVYANPLSTGFIDHLNLENNSFNTNPYGVYTQGNNINEITISNCDFINSYSNGILINNTLTSKLEVKNSNFTNNTTAINVSPTSGSVTSGILSGNAFNLNSTYNLFITTPSGSTNAFSVTDNSFTGILIPSLGYAAKIINSGGSLCLDFVNNQAFPETFSGGINPYYFNNTSGIFNLTPNSTQTNNIGTISSSGLSGSCAF